MNQVFIIYLLVSLSIATVGLFILWRLIEKAQDQLKESEQKVSRMTSRHLKQADKIDNIKKVLAYNWRLFRK